MSFNAHDIYLAIRTWLVESGIPESNIILYHKNMSRSMENIPSAGIFPESGKIIPVEQREHQSPAQGLLRRYLREQSVLIQIFSSSPDHAETAPLERVIDSFLMAVKRNSIIGTGQGKEGARPVSFMPSDWIKYRLSDRQNRDILCAEVNIRCLYYLYEEYFIQ